MEEPDRKVLRAIASQVAELHTEWPEFKALVFSIRQQQQEHERRLVKIEGLWVAHDDQHSAERDRNRMRVREGAAAYDPDLTPHGGIRLPPDGWERLQTEFGQFREEARIAKARAEGATAAFEGLKKRILFYLAVAGSGGSILAYVLTHFFKL
jgi:hypothetical protein